MTAHAMFAMAPSFRTPTESRAGYSLHPLVILALLVWLLNDHVLKAMWPGWWTGKLSDLTGLAVFPLIPYAVTDLLRERCDLPPPTTPTLLVWILATGLAMIAIKTLGPAADAYRWGLGALQWPIRILHAGSLVGLRPVQLTQDPTDLLTLPALIVPWCVAHREHRANVTARAASRRSPS